MYAVERLTRNDYDELLDFLNTTFGYAREDGFETLLPAMWRRDDAHMGKHLAIRLDGRIRAALGIYPLTVHAGSEKLLFATCGNVGTEKAYREKGLMKTLMQAAIREMEAMGVDAARLGGQRQRYERYGFEMVGTTLSWQLTQKNARLSRLAQDMPPMAFFPLAPEDDQALAFIASLQEKQPWYVQRGRGRDFYDVMRAWKHGVFIARDESGAPVGALSASADAREIAEAYALSPQIKYAMLRGWLLSREIPAVSFTSAAWDSAFNRLAGEDCESMSQSGSTRLNVMNFQKLANALMSLRSAPLDSADEVIVEVPEYGRLCFSGATCALTRRAPDLTLSKLQAARLFFGPDAPDNVCALPEDKAFLMRALFPLPMYWNGQDRV